MTAALGAVVWCLFAIPSVGLIVELNRPYRPCPDQMPAVRYPAWARLT